MITKAAITTEKIVSALVSVKINVEPNKVLHTSPERLAGGEKMFKRVGGTHTKIIACVGLFHSNVVSDHVTVNAGNIHTLF